MFEIYKRLHKEYISLYNICLPNKNITTQKLRNNLSSAIPSLNEKVVLSPVFL